MGLRGRSLKSLFLGLGGHPLLRSTRSAKEGVSPQFHLTRSPLVEFEKMLYNKLIKNKRRNKIWRQKLLEKHYQQLFVN